MMVNLPTAGMALNRDSGPASESALHAVAKQFETLLAQQMLSSMRNVSFGDDGLGAHGGHYREMLDQQMAKALTQGKGLGVADQLVAQMRAAGLIQATPTAADKPDMTALQLPSRGSMAARRPVEAPTAPAAPVGNVGEGVAARISGFVERVMPYARAAAEALGVPVRAVVAHAALESGWGRHAPGDNFFGIKADARWNGAQAVRATQEFEGGRMVDARERFRSYEGASQAFDDYARFLQQNPRYREALARGEDGPAFLRGIAEAGYATDPDYADKLRRIHDSPHLDAALRSAGLGGEHRV
jgi:flagellar protein FlgJ